MATSFMKSKNRAVTTLNGGITDADLTILVTDSSVFPTTYPFPVSINDEICSVTNNNTGTNTLTITRAQESTSAAAADDGDTVENTWTAKYITDLNTAVNAIEGGSMLDDTAGGTDAEVTKAPTSNVMYDHGVATTGVHGVGALGFKVTSKLKEETRDMTAASGDVSYTGYGFSPTALIMQAVVDATTIFALGFADVNVADYGIWHNPEGLWIQTSGLLVLRETTAGGVQQYAVIKSRDADGFSITWTKTGTPSAGTASIQVLALR